MSRLTNDVDAISITLHSALIQFISGIITLVGTIVLMLVRSVTLTLIALSIVPLMFLLTQLITKHTSRLFMEQQQTLGELNGKIEEIISGQKVVKLFCREQQAIADFEESNQKTQENRTKSPSAFKNHGPHHEHAQQPGLRPSCRDWRLIGR
jgi:ABC-type multidrug transport system, ATPase and permease components